MKVIGHRYGKERVRLLKVLRGADGVHQLKELSIRVMLSGDFGRSFSEADNRLVVATDSMKNTINVLAFHHLQAETEPFVRGVAAHFLERYPQVGRVEIDVEEAPYERMSFDGQPHPHAFRAAGDHRFLCRLVQTRENALLSSGVDNLLILKSTASAFEKFVRDEFTTLPEANDRILATRLRALWQFAEDPPSFSGANKRILDTMLRVFAVNFSPSVQATLYEMAAEALAQAREISEITLAMPNKHYLKIPLDRFGIADNPNILFLPTGEPHGQIEATVARTARP